MTKTQLKALQQGRERAAKRERRAAVGRVRAYRAWLRRDSEISALRKRGHSAKREHMPAVPSDNDFKIAREEGV